MKPLNEPLTRHPDRLVKFIDSWQVIQLEAAKIAGSSIKKNDF